MPKTMKAAVLHGIDDLRYEDVPVPELGDHDVLVKIKACGICGSDLPRVLKTGTYHFPTIPGHEFGGEVVEECRGNPSDSVPSLQALRSRRLCAVRTL